MSNYTITWETYREMQDRITSLEKMKIPQKAVHEAAAEIILLEAEREIDRLKLEIKQLKGE